MARLSLDPRLRSAVVPHAVLISDLGPEERLLVAVIALHGEVSFPARSTLAALMGCSTRSVARSIRVLEAKGWLTVKPRARQDGGRTSNLYHLHPPTGQVVTGGVGQNGTGPHANLAQQEVREEVLNSESEEGTYVPSAALEPPAPPPDRPVKGRKYPPEVHAAALAFTDEFRKDCTAAGSPPAPDTFARDLSLACKVVQHYGVESARDMGARFFKFREVRNMMLTMAEFYRVREYLFHEMMKGAVRKPYPTFRGYDRA